VIRVAFARISVDVFGYAAVAVAKLINKHPVTLSRWRSNPPSIESAELQFRVIAAIKKGKYSVNPSPVIKESTGHRALFSVKGVHGSR
jgi:hypothetical protein